MTSRNFLSNKKNVKISFSTSPALTDWIKRYVNNKKQENPEDERFKSLSSFIHYSLDILMNALEKGKTLDDFLRFVDQTIKNFYDQITFKAIIPLFEESIEMNKYIHPSRGLISFFTAFRKTFMDGLSMEQFIEDVDKNLKHAFERFENFIQQNNVTNKLSFEKTKDLYIIELSGYYKNLHYEFCKSFASIMGIIGLKLRDTTYISDKSLNYFYMRFDCEKSYILTQSKPKLKEQIKLARENLKRILKYEQLLNDKTEHVWLNTSQFKGAIISFNDIQTGIEYIRANIKELERTVDLAELSYYILLIFEHFHWIIIDNKTPPSFHYVISKNGHEVEYMIMEEFLPEIIKNK